tara:strand:- start:2446 stop:2718 length:273 start_codon:yes stop_codon:yes gene_type:complete
MSDGYELEKYEGNLGSVIVPILLLTTLGGLILLGMWVFEYGETSKDVIKGKKVNNESEKNNYLVPGAVLSSVSTILTVIIMIHLHNQAEK